MEHNSKRLVFLAIKLFKNNPEGKEFLQLLKAMHLETPVFPISKLDLTKVKRHGGPLGWAAFREGNLDMIRKIELMSKSENYLFQKQDEKK
jgi:hypothetical protein